MKIVKFYICLLICFMTLCPPFLLVAFTRRDSDQTENTIQRQDIRSVQFYRKGWEFSLPLITLGNDQQLLLNFDQLSDDVSNFVYQITLCDADWLPSSLITSEYMGGFTENQIYDYAASINTTIGYVNYQLLIPNDQVRILLSGNYLLSVYDEKDRSKPVFTRRFYVVEPLTEIGGEVRKSSFEGYLGRDQQIDFTLGYSQLRVQDPTSEIKVVVMQNSKSDNAKSHLNPTFIRERQMSFQLDRNNVFAGGNEFRNFDIKNLKNNGLRMAKMEFIRPDYHVSLFPDQGRELTDYQTERDLNGRFLIKNDRASDADLESDYVVVHFSLNRAEPETDGEVYVFGALTDWRCTPANKMSWNADAKRYEASLFLKQGFYDYQYVFVKPGNQQIDDTFFEGSHVETENDYQIFVYYRPFSARHDRLVGYQTLNSVKR